MTLPDYSMPLLTQESQAATAWTNVIPNALASYYTYVPYSNADAVALGFPSSCGNRALATPGDQASTEDCYTITVKSFAQQLALPGIFGGGAGLLDEDGVAFGAATRAFGYGSGGQNWTPPGAIVAVTGNAPAPFTNGTFSTSGIWHFPAPTLRGTQGRPIRIQWLNELPNVQPAGFDPTVDCGPNAPYCYPYNRIVTHVHGAHVTDDSDGYALAWFTPGFALTGPGWRPSTHGPEGTYRYPMDGEASTIWYHDHALGTTHNNTQMGLAGFFPITDANEQALIAAHVLPTGSYELGFALQDRMFDTAGQFAMPDYPVYDRNSPGCTLTEEGLPEPGTCDRLDWMKAVDGHLIPYDPASPLLLNSNNAGAPFPAASTTLEYFGNMPVVNGVTYGKFDVEPRVYRMRLIGGTDSRTWIMKLVRRDTGAVIPFWQIGSEQGLLNHPVRRETIDLMPGERVDVLVDLTGIPVGTRIVMKNLGPDSPYAGPDSLLDPEYEPSIDIPEIMEFDVIPLSGADTILAPSASTSLRAPIVPLVPTPGTSVRKVSLVEITDEYGRTMPTIDSRGFMPMDVPITEVVKLNNTEQWDIINTTVDAHPMHLHLVAFQVISRQAFTDFVPAVTDTVGQNFVQPQYTGVGPEIPPAEWEAGWKDTVDCPPGMVTKVRAKFDIEGEKYVWHCHILSHEEHDMMRPLAVRACDDNNPCTADTIDPRSFSCVHTPTPGASCGSASDTDCDNPDTCNAFGVCSSNNEAPGTACTDDANPCTNDACATGGVCAHPAKPDGTLCSDGNLCTTADACSAGVCRGTSHLNEPHPRTVGYYKKLCQNNHTGDALTTADASCVADTTATFDTHTVSDLCAIITRHDGGDDHGDDHCGWGSGSHNTYCDKARAELVALALNRCRARVCDAQQIDSNCAGSTSTTVGQSFTTVDTILGSATQTAPAAVCKGAQCLAKEINRGKAFIIDDVRCDRTNVRPRGGMTCHWSVPLYNDDTTAPRYYEIWRRSHGPGAFTKVATVNTTSYSTVDPDGNFDYDVVPVE